MHLWTNEPKQRRRSHHPGKSPAWQASYAQRQHSLGHSSLPSPPWLPSPCQVPQHQLKVDGVVPQPADEKPGKPWPLPGSPQPTDVTVGCLVIRQLLEALPQQLYHRSRCHGHTRGNCGCLTEQPKVEERQDEVATADINTCAGRPSLIHWPATTSLIVLRSSPVSRFRLETKGPPFSIG